MNDLVKQLRNAANQAREFGTCFLDDEAHAELLRQAADHIVRLGDKAFINVRNTDPDTSRDAAPKTRSLTDDHMHLLTIYKRHGGLTADEAGGLCGMVERRACYWKRISELAALGYLVDTGERRMGLAGKLQMVRTITEAGLGAACG